MKILLDGHVLYLTRTINAFVKQNDDSRYYIARGIAKWSDKVFAIASVQKKDPITGEFTDTEEYAYAAKFSIIIENAIFIIDVKDWSLNDFTKVYRLKMV